VLANRWLATGTDGSPAIRIGRSIRIPTVALERLAQPQSTLPPEPLRLVDAG
jgi:hypothetical protein